MVAPVDATATLTVGEGEEAETFTLAMNFRTFALAKAAGHDFFAMGDQSLDAFALVAILKAFATPAHPKLTEDEAFAIVMRHGDQVGETIRQMSEAFGAQIGKPKGGARPPKAQRPK